MKLIFPIALLIAAVQFGHAYEVAGAKPLDKLDAEVAKVKESKKLICIVYTGRDESCPNCAEAAENGVRAVRGLAECVVVKEAEVKDKAIMDKLPPAVRKMLDQQPTNAWVSFSVFNPDMTTLVATISRTELQKDKRATKAFADKIRAAKAELK